MNKSKFNTKYHQGVFTPKNKEKYIGYTPVKFRSSWEFFFFFMTYLDNNESVTKWSSETIVIPYLDLRNKSHRYYADFYYEIINSENPALMDRVLVEIKPSKELTPPERPLNETTKALSNYEYSIRMHIKNKLKWDAAIDFCNKRGIKFVIITEEHLKKYGIMK
jgi:hypothetical protein